MPRFVGIKVSKGRMDIHVLPIGSAFAVQRQAVKRLLTVLRAMAPMLVLDAISTFEARRVVGRWSQVSRLAPRV